MVARINTSKNISKAINYNEQKVQQGKAEILFAKNFLKDVHDMNFYDKLRHFEKLMSLNQRASTNTLHVSLNFDPSETLSNEKMIEVARSYMEKIGFGDQPYLVYRHYDSAHPHIHIVSTNISFDGKRISMHNLGKNQSEKARKEIEIEFDLVRAEDKKNADTNKIQPLNAAKATYGKSETRRAISNILVPILNQYRFASLAELNAVLKLYNIQADRGEKGSRVYERGGLLYHMLDEKGNKVGIGVKASSFFMKPTLKMLEKKFAENETLRQPHKKRITANIDWILNSRTTSLDQFIKAMQKENISVVLRENKEGVVYGITYVDHKTKCVFNGSDLGKPYAAKAMLERCAEKEKITQGTGQSKSSEQIYASPVEGQSKNSSPDTFARQPSDVLIELVRPIEENNMMPFEPAKRKRKKRKKLSL